jgi:hypothetical protein
MFGRARHDESAGLAQRDRGRQVLLDRHVTVELRVVGAIGDAEAALAEHRTELVGAQARAGRQHAARLARFHNWLRLAIGYQRFRPAP